MEKTNTNKEAQKTKTQKTQTKQNIYNRNLQRYQRYKTNENKKNQADNKQNYPESNIQVIKQNMPKELEIAGNEIKNIK
jgi:hypothetical protein